MQSLTIIGNLTRDPELRTTSAGVNVCDFTVAVNRRQRRDAQNGQPEADFIRCKAFGGAAKFANDYLAKGIKVNVCGQLQTRTYDAEDGHRNFVTEVLVETQEFAESAAVNRRIVGSQAQADNAPAGPAEPSEPACGGYNPETDHDFGDAELPFS